MQLGQALLRQLVQKLLGARSQANQHLAAVIRASHPPNVAVFDHAIHQLHRAVVAQQKLIGQRTDRGGRPLGKPANRQEHMILMGFETRRAGGLVAQIQKPSNLAAELGEGAIVRGAGSPIHPDAIIS